ncbi:MAG: hypothetical protein ACXVB9_11065 [Bdellovibrionota bacterium]
MRSFVFTIALALVFAALPAHGEDLASAPGWSLTKAADPAQEDNVYQDSRVFYTLKPPDARPAITVDSNTADRLRSGDASAEGTYSGQGATGKKKEEDEFVYGNHGNGIVMADPINSTLTLDEGRKDLPPPVAQNSAGQSGPKSSGISGFSSGGLSSNSGHVTAQKALSMVNGSGASRMPSAAAAAANTTGGSSAAPGPAPFQDPRAIAAASGRVAPQGTPFAGGIAVNNVAAGFGEKVGTSSSTDTNFIIWPNGDPATMTKTNTNTSTCASSGTSFTFSTPTIQRITIPTSCHNVRVRAWGAGGGSGSSTTPSDSEGFGGLAVVGDGGGGAYIFTQGPVDNITYDLVVLVGSPGGDASGGTAGKAGFIGGGPGAVASAGGAGGGGGGYSGVFLVDKTVYNNGETPQIGQLAIAVAAGGGGGSAAGGAGGAGGFTSGGGALGAQSGSGGPGIGNGRSGSMLSGGPAGDGGGGGGGGMYGGGGSAATASNPAAPGGGGGSSFFRFKTSSSVGMDGSGATAANSNYTPRGEAGNAGKAGIIFLDFY